KNPVKLPKGVELSQDSRQITVKGSKGALTIAVNPRVVISQDDNVLTFVAANGDQNSKAQAGTLRTIINNMVMGVSEGFERKLQLVGVGYRAQAEVNKVNLSLGFAHPLEYQPPDGVTAQAPCDTGILLKAADKQV